MPANIVKQPPSVEEAHQLPSVEDNLAVMAEQLDRLEAETTIGGKIYPSWWYERPSVANHIPEQLKNPEIAPQNISRYFELYQRQQRLRAAIAGSEPATDAISTVCQQIGTHVAARGFNTESTAGPMHQAIAKRLLEASHQHTNLDNELDLLRQAYGLTKRTDLLSLNNSTGEYANVVRPLLRTETVITSMRAVDQEHSTGDTWPEMQKKMHIWMQYALSTATGIEEAEAASYTFSASRKERNQDLLAILEKFDHFGAERLRTLTAFSGIQGLEGYSIDQLERMEDLLLHPAEAAERLAAHDVNIMIINRVGDHNGIFHDAASAFEDDKGRTLFFEITRLRDIYRHMATLRDLGIHPSSIILAAHSAPGQFIVSDERDPSLKRRDIATIAGQNLVRLANNDTNRDKRQYGYSLHGMKGMARIIDEIMQPSRAIDDAAENLGRKKLIFQACDAATNIESNEITESGEKAVQSIESVVGRLGKELVANHTTSNVDIYGAPAGMQLHRTKQGVRYSGTPKTIGQDRVPLYAVRMRIENGQTLQDEIDEILMHQDMAPSTSRAA